MGPAAFNGFVHFDDYAYVTENPRVRTGLTASGIAWAFTSFDAGNWHPLTWLSHMADVEMFGLDPRGHHGVSLALHALNSALLVSLVLAMTGLTWPAFLVAALFAVHPLHVESVAWVAERKDLLSTFFLLLALGAWIRGLRRSGNGRSAVALCGFALGLLSKPMVVTLPVLLLILDYWPLGRWTPAGGARAEERVRVAKRLLGEKVPFFLLATCSSVITIAAQRAGGGLRSLEAYPFVPRIENALVAYVRYLGMTVRPTRLAFFYPNTGDPLPWFQWAGSALLLLALSAAALAMRRRTPCFLAGWVWYLAALLPVIGLVQVGNQAIADRYTYVPLLGLFAVAAAVMRATARRGAGWEKTVAALTAAAICALIALSRDQARVWSDDLALSRHALRVTEGNWVAHVGYGLCLDGLGKPTEAVEQYRQALRHRPAYFEALANLGETLYRLRRYPEAAQALSQAVSLQPDRTALLFRLGLAHLAQRDIVSARAIAARLAPRDPVRARQLLQLME